MTLAAFLYKGEHQKQLLVSGENTRLPPVWRWFKSLHQCHMWDEFGVGSSFPPEVLWFSPLLINQHFQILIRSGMRRGLYEFLRAYDYSYEGFIARQKRKTTFIYQHVKRAFP